MKAKVFLTHREAGCLALLIVSCWERDIEAHVPRVQAWVTEPQVTLPDIQKRFPLVLDGFFTDLAAAREARFELLAQKHGRWEAARMAAQMEEEEEDDE